MTTITWRSRAIELVPEDADGVVAVSWVALLGGEMLPDGYDLWTDSPEQMVGFRANRAAERDPKQPASLPVRMNPDRVAWRDSASLLGIGRGTRTPGVLGWLGRLSEKGYLPSSSMLPIDVMGQIANRTKLVAWRHERLPLTLALMIDPDRRDILAKALLIAEAAGRCVGDTSNGSPMAFIAHVADGNTAVLPQGQRDKFRAFARAFDDSRTYWARMDVAFGRFIVALADDGRDDAAVVGAWREAAAAAARTAFYSAIEPLRSAGEALVMAQAELSFERRLKAALSGKPADAGAADAGAASGSADVDESATEEEDDMTGPEAEEAI